MDNRAGRSGQHLKPGPIRVESLYNPRVDRIRAPYAREATDRPRRTSFCATVNPDEFLKDETGDRRFWVVPVDTVAQRMLKELPETWFIQVWAEAVTWWRTDPQSFRLTGAERDMLDRANVAYRVSLPGEEEIREALDWDLPPEQWGQFTSTEVKRQLFFSDSRITTQQIGRVLKKLARENGQITVAVNTDSKVKTYTLPLKKVILQFTDTTESTSKEC